MEAGELWDLEWLLTGHIMDELVLCCAPFCWC